MDAREVRLEAELTTRLSERAEALASLGSLSEDSPVLSEAERASLARLTERLANTYPYGEPRYVGQMLKPPHPLAWAAYATAMLLNPNNHALDGGPATAEMEREAVAAIATLFGLPSPLGHLTSSGTIANLEALWVARELQPDKTVLYGENAHYTHERMCAVLGIAGESVAQDELGRIDTAVLERRLAAGDVGTVVATLGTTSLGALDDVAAIAALCAAHGARLHVDAAYGGFFALLADGGDPGVLATPFAALARADSIVVDPHKHGLQPYGCGCVLFADPAVGRLYAHDSPYTYFTSRELHLGEISLECSRAGAAAAALWTTFDALPLTRSGLGAALAQSRSAATAVAAELERSELELVVEPQLDILCPFPHATSAAEITARCEAAFDSLARAGWHAAKLRVSTDWLRRRHDWIEPDEAEVTTLRLVLMKPSHAAIATQLAAVLREHL
ncbi:MAG TPA: aminotransferase class V-fold PLP-dependent enzyme [Solirubrobacteraceae bacterium]|jgi:glutamate/tyrosine decarboxylase-like PLP-dependent enzyme|nr:aminotransferase class V-fold PLP-dependent enzyme [Solirubrobacteraceae bacterium]